MAPTRIIDTKAILAENRKRVNALLDDSYNPVTGKGSPIPRFELQLDPLNTVYLPETMRHLPEIEDIMQYRTLREYVIVSEKEKNPERKLTLPEIEKCFVRAVQALQIIRCKYDFEYWAYTFIKITDKKSKALVPFRLRNAQRIILQALEEERAKGGTVYAILVKARQFGGSTLIQIWMMWIQTLLHENWHSSIVTDVDDQARRILNMYTIAARNYPDALGTVTLGNFQGSGKNRIIKERGCIISVGSMQKPDSLRSADNALVHCSEVGLWKKTQGKNPDDLVQTLLGSLAEAEDTAFIMESTAKGVGNFFHQTWVNNESFRKIFVPWFKIELYLTRCDQKGEFIKTWDEYEWALWEMGATIQGILWYRNQLKRFRGDRWRMQSEFPSTPEEAFSSTGNKFYSPYLMQHHKKFVCPPNFIGDVFGKASTGKEALEGLSFQSNPLGKDNCLWVWGLPDNKERISNRYIVSVDIGGVWDGADFSSINVIDRYGLLEGGAIERAATWHGHIDQIVLAWKAAQIAEFYNHALLVVECNSLKTIKEEDTEGSYFISVLNEIAPYYDNLYKRQSPERVRQGRPNLYGFHMNQSTKPSVMAKKRAYMEQDMYLEYDERAYYEACIMEIKPDGRIGNVDGKGNHDDIEVPTATALFISSMAEPPRRIEGRPRQYNNVRASLEAAI